MDALGHNERAAPVLAPASAPVSAPASAPVSASVQATALVQAPATPDVVPRALRALVGWAQQLIKTRAQELSLAELIRHIKVLSPLAEPIRYHYQIALTPQTCLLAQVKLLDNGQVELSVYFPSLVSLEGPLPLELLQELYRQKQDGQHSMLDFIRLLSERLSQLYGRSLQLTSGQSVHHAGLYQDLSLALVGANEDFSYQLPPALLCGALSALKALDQGGARSLERLLQQVLGCPACIVERVFSFYQLPTPMRTCLGQANCTLGQDSLLGDHYPSTQRRFALILGPLDYEQLVQLQPGQPGHRLIKRLLALALGPRSLECVVEYRLRKFQARPTALNGHFALGRGTILCAPPHQEMVAPSASSRQESAAPRTAQSTPPRAKGADWAQSYWSWYELMGLEQAVR